MIRNPKAGAAILLAVALAGCTDGATQRDAGSPDAGVTAPDAGPPDAGATEPDTGPPAIPPLPCEPVDGTGCSPGQKCTLVPTGGSNPAFKVGCQELQGALMAFTSDCKPYSADDCGPGLFCYAGRELDGVYCRPLCHSDSDCSQPTDRGLWRGLWRCLWFVSGPPPTGHCARGCTLFGNDCPGTGSCSRITLNADMNTFWMGCTTPGPLEVGRSCVDANSCAAGAYCWGQVCRAFCDNSHPCAADTKCEAIAGLPAGGGVCR